MIPRDFGKIERSLFVDDLCKDTDKLDSLIYEIYEGAESGPIKEVLRSLKWKYYLGKGYREAKKWLSSYSF